MLKQELVGSNPVLITFLFDPKLFQIINQSVFLVRAAIFQKKMNKGILNDQGGISQRVRTSLISS